MSKPGKLTEIELIFIQTHARSGYEILREIPFPWPIAEIVLQHHEKIDGSGYPNGLSGSQILTEAKILSVADVVEAMAPHRPYRPSLGIAAALEEIEKKKGIHFDKKAVNACLSLFTRKDFTFLLCYEAVSSVDCEDRTGCPLRRTFRRPNACDERRPAVKIAF